MKSKVMSGSQRGLYFTFKHKNIGIGAKIKYVLAGKTGKLFIVPAIKNVKANTVSRRKISDNKSKALIDLRAKRVREFTSKADKMIVGVNNHSIVVTAIKEDKVLYRASSDNKDDLIRIASVFSGCGMLDYPFYLDKRFKLVFASDFEEDMCSSYRENIGDHVVCADIKELTGEDIPNADVIIGGPVCKAFSNANRSKTRLKDHEGAALMYEYIRLVNEGNYKAFVIENVPELITACGGEFFNAVLECLPGFTIRHKVLQDCQYGGYSIRKRVFIIGSKIGVPKFLLPKIKNEKSYKTVGDALAKVDKTWFNYKDLASSNKKTVERMSYVPIGGNFKDIPKDIRSKGVHSCSYKRLDPNAPSITLANFRKSVIIHPTLNRIISVAEALAISGFEPPFKVIGASSKRVEQVANGVPFALGNAIRKTIKRLFDTYNYKTV